MNILYLHQYFITPSEPGGTRSYWIAKELISRGHKVTVISSSNSISSKAIECNIDGIKVIYLRIHYSNSMSILSRLIAFFSFMLISTIKALQIKNINLVIATSTPLTIGFPALVLKSIKNIPFIFEVRDLWPEVPIQMGGLKNPILISFARWFERELYRKSNHIIALSPGMAEGIKSAGISETKISVIPNMAKIDQFWPRESKHELIESFGLKSNTFKLVHFGALGIANGAKYIIDCAEIVKENNSIEFIFLGGGSTENYMKEVCHKKKLKNVHFLGKYSMADTSEIVNFCDASIISFLDIPILYTNSPNKFFDSLSAGKPIIVNSAGWTKEIVEIHKCGEYVNPNSPNELAEILIRWSHSPELLKIYASNARKLAETEYDKSILCRKFTEIIDNQFTKDV